MNVLVLDFEFFTLGLSLRRLHHIDELRDSVSAGE